MNRAHKFRKTLMGVGLTLGAILFCAFYLTFRVATQTRTMNYWVDHAQEVLGLIEDARLQRSRLANEVWAYRVSRQPELPLRFRENVKTLKSDLSGIKELMVNREEQEGRAVELEQALTKQLPQLEEAMKKVSQPGSDAAIGPLDWSVLTILSERQKDLFDQLENTERQLLKEREQKLQENMGRTQTVLFVAGIITFVTLSAGLYLIQREILKRAKMEQGLRHAQALLGVKFEEQRGELAHVLADLHEQILERRAAEERANQMNMELEERVKERTSELREMNKEMESFSYSVSHDLRAPLRHMEGFSRILQEQHAQQLPEEARQLLDRIRNAAMHMAALVEDLLQLSRIGRHVPKREWMSMNGLVEAARGEVLLEKPDRDIEWKVDELPEVEGDPVLLRQVFVNLLANAVKFTRKVPHAVIEIGHKEEGKEVVFFVRDNGAGFDPRYADKLFGVFQRLHRQDEFEGTGIGLATVQRIIHKHGGKVWAESQPGHGAAFYFSLPVKTKLAETEKQLVGVPA